MSGRRRKSHVRRRTHSTSGTSCIAPTLRMRLTVNGIPHELPDDLPGHETLLATLRDRLDLTGTKLVCGRGECGACTVLFDANAHPPSLAYACLTLTSACDGRSVTTIEGIGREDALHPVQTAFMHHDAAQCGFCTP